MDAGRQVSSQAVVPQDGYYRATFVLAVAAGAGDATALVHIALEDRATGQLFHTGPDLALPF